MILSLGKTQGLAGAGLAVYVLTLCSVALGVWLHALAGAMLLAVLSGGDIARRHGAVWAALGGLWILLLWPVAAPAYWLFSRWNPLRAATMAPVLALLLLAGWSLAASAFVSPLETRDVTLELDGAPYATQAERKQAVQEILNGNPFRVPWWLSNGHAQSFWGPIARRGLEVPFRSERWDTPDADFVFVRFFDGEPGKPLVVVLHGLEGSANSPYIKGMNLAFNRLGWNVATMEFRFCSGEINAAQRIYHMGETTDADFVIRKLAARMPETPIYVCGFSLGGNVVAKWLGEQGDAVPENVHGGAVISPPFDPAVSAPTFHEILGGFYAKNFLRTLKPKALEKARQFPGLIDEAALMACKDFYTYDTIVTARLHGFEDAEDYWRKVGCHQFLPGIRVPTMLLTSADDPFNPAETIPHAAAEESPWLHPQWTARGGHVGFVMGPSPLKVRYWMEEQTVAFFQAYEALRTS